MYINADVWTTCIPILPQTAVESTLEIIHTKFLGKNYVWVPGMERLLCGRWTCITLAPPLVCHIHGHSLEFLQLCDIRIPSLLFWNPALLASLECSFGCKTGECRFLFSCFSWRIAPNRHRPIWKWRATHRPECILSHAKLNKPVRWGLSLMMPSFCLANTYAHRSGFQRKNRSTVAT